MPEIHHRRNALMAGRLAVNSTVIDTSLMIARREELDRTLRAELADDIHKQQMIFIQ